jgi:aminoglycoside phosphotransferase (APT) family kinase protein
MTIEDYLTQFYIPGVHTLFSRVLVDYQRDRLSMERCFTLGDFAPGAVLLAVSGDGDQPIGVIDWEFSGVGRGPDEDMSQFLALDGCLSQKPTPERH